MSIILMVIKNAFLSILWRFFCQVDFNLKKSPHFDAVKHVIEYDVIQKYQIKKCDDKNIT
jgi:hypothetical protein